MTSHEYAGKLKELADFLLSKPDFETKQSDKFAYIQFYYWTDKAEFLSAVKALGSGTKEWKEEEIIFSPLGTDMLRLQISRSAVCRLVQEAKYECEPLLSDDEVASLERAS